ncbi:RNA polymerase sigma factor [Porticoccus sp. GXU_MW_L64]
MTLNKPKTGHKENPINEIRGRTVLAQYRERLHEYFLRRTSNQQDSEELTQEVFCKVIKRGGIEKQGNLEPYLFTVANSVLKDRIRSDSAKLQYAHHPFDDDKANDATSSVEEALESQMRYERFLASLDKLGRQTRTIFLLNRYEGLTYRDIAHRYGISSSAVEKHMMQAIKVIRAALGGDS